MVVSMLRSLAAGLCSLAAFGLAAPAIANEANALTKKGADPEQVICKVERFVGSNLKNRV